MLLSVINSLLALDTSNLKVTFQFLVMGMLIMFIVMFVLYLLIKILNFSDSAVQKEKAKNFFKKVWTVILGKKSK